MASSWRAHGEPVPLEAVAVTCTVGRAEPSSGAAQHVEPLRRESHPPRLPPFPSTRFAAAVGVSSSMADLGRADRVTVASMSCRSSKGGGGQTSVGPPPQRPPQAAAVMWCTAPGVGPPAFMLPAKIGANASRSNWLDNNNIEGTLPPAICSLPELWRIGYGALAMVHVSGYGACEWLWRIGCGALAMVHVSGYGACEWLWRIGYGALAVAHVSGYGACEWLWRIGYGTLAMAHVSGYGACERLWRIGCGALAMAHVSGYGACEWLWRIMMSNNYLYGPLPDCIFNKCVNQIDVSGNSLYGRINRNFRSMVADGDALINLAHNFFFGDAVLLAAGCQVCPIHISKPNNLVLGDTGVGAVGKCATSFTAIRDYSVAGAGKGARVSVAGNCLTLIPDAECAANATQRSTAACQAFCSITDNGPCDGHGECVPPAPASPSNFTCLCHAGYSPLDSGNGSTCAVVNSTTTTVSSLSTGAIVGIAVGCFAGFVLLAAVLTCVLWPRGPRKWEGLEVCEQYTLHQMVKATDNWAKENEVGRGGFGVVYKGHSPQGQLWAIKRSTVMTNNFEREVRAMATLNHVNLVRLLGFCVDQNVETGNQEQILVYEFVANRDLQYHIFKTKNPLSLRQRLRLAQGAAEGLAYLHGFETPIIHRDIKPANILVTADFQAKVADFGLLKRLTHCEGDATRVAGTPGYVDPDYNRTRVVTTKSDVFSFGIVLLELLTGSTPIRYESHIRDWAIQKVEAYALEELKDSKLDASEEAIVAFADLALDCVKMPGTRRPDMKAVAHSLNALIEKFCPDKEPCELVEKLSSLGSQSSQSAVLSSGTEGHSGTNQSGSSSNGLGSRFRVLDSWMQHRFSEGY
ncbi:unnamed protein product [Closterium sp. NIES-64]|nr:unnamed protein product [Closterium sp. NIES-64]